jgi:hypothetical protein
LFTEQKTTKSRLPNEARLALVAPKELKTFIEVALEEF